MYPSKMNQTAPGVLLYVNLGLVRGCAEKLRCVEADLMQVLVVEDEALVAMLLKDMLAEIGHDVVITAGRLKDALAAADQADIDFAVIDLNLRGEPTFEVGDRLKARGIPFFFATGYGPGGLPPEWAGHNTLQKPFQPIELEAAVAACLASRSNRD